jgi:hypothetical protein
MPIANITIDQVLSNAAAIALSNTISAKVRTPPPGRATSGTRALTALAFNANQQTNAQQHHKTYQCRGPKRAEFVHWSIGVCTLLGGPVEHAFNP